MSLDGADHLLTGRNRANRAGPASSAPAPTQLAGQPIMSKTLKIGM
jgi:hypothetical protein